MLVIDFLLLSVIVLCAYLGPMVLRRMGPGQRLYGWMIVGDLALAIVALASRRSEGPNATADLIATIAIGGAVCLVFVPPLLRSLARRALVADRLRLARWLVNAREHLQPGMGARQEGELISTIIEVRSGQVDAAIDRLRERRDRVGEPAARRPIDERIIMTYLYARRWEDAIDWLEHNLEPGAASPQLAVELVRAYCELGRLDEAALLVQRIEEVQSSAEEPIWVLLVSRARLVFLAFLGRIAAVEAILGPRGPLGSMPDAARFFWFGLVRLKAGDRSGARSSLEKAAELSGRDGRARELAQHTLSRIDEPGVAGPLDVSPVVSELADRLSRLAEDAPADLPTAAEKGRAARRTRPPRLSGVGVREIPVTAGLIAANLAAAVAVFIHWGTTSDLGALIQAGANVKAAVAEGELWRLSSSMFLHVGLLHLGINVYGLWVLGRLVEQMVGSLRFFVLYVGAGLSGAAASFYLGGATTSVGASGAIFGLLAAAVVELAIHRKSYPRRWSGALLGMLLFLGAANVAIGFIYEVIDQSAHLGGLVGGAIFGLALSRKHRFAQRRWVRPLVMVLAVGAAGAVGYGAVAATTSDFADTIAGYPRATRSLGGITVEAPEPWSPESDTELYDPSLIVLVQLIQAREPAETDAELLEALEIRREAERKEGAKSFGLVGAHTVEDRMLPVPPPWVSRELEVRTEGGLVGEQRIRIAVIAREKDGRLWLGSIYYPASLARALAPAVADMLRSAR